MKCKHSLWNVFLAAFLLAAFSACSSGSSDTTAECVAPDTDSDNDGICDSVDECVDTDADTVCDSEDDCIDVDADGVCDDVADSYTVSVTVTGLDGSLTLLLNADESKVITADGTYAFSSALTDAATYEVSNERQPTTQSCALSGASGTIAAADATVTVSCANKFWRDPSDNDASDSISANSESDVVGEIATAMDEDGNTLVVWAQEDTGDADSPIRIYKAEYRNGEWDTPDGLDANIESIVVDEDDGSDVTAAANPDVAMDADGNAIIVWLQNDTTGVLRVFKHEFRNGSWQDGPSDFDPTEENEDGPNDDGVSIAGAVTDDADPQVAMDDDGNAVIVWTNDNGLLYFTEYRDDQWSYLRDETGADDDSDDDILLDNPDGERDDYEDGKDFVLAVDQAAEPRVDMDNDGNTVMVYLGNDGTNIQVYKSEYRNEAWRHPNNTADYISTGSGDADFARVALDNDGNAIIVWQQSDGTHDRIYLTEYRPFDDPTTPDVDESLDTEWTDPVAISVAATNAFSLDLAMDDDGNAIVTWVQSEGGDHRVYFAEYTDDEWSYLRADVDEEGEEDDEVDAFPVDIFDDIQDFADIISPPTQDASDVHVSMDNNGNAVIVWVESDGTYTQIYRSEKRDDEWEHPEALDVDEDTVPDGLLDDEVSPSNSNAQNPQVILSDFGDAVIVWKQEQNIDFSDPADGFSEDYLGVFLSQYR